jgi:hypothetical protein
MREVFEYKALYGEVILAGSKLAFGYAFQQSSHDTPVLAQRIVDITDIVVVAAFNAVVVIVAAEIVAEFFISASFKRFAAGKTGIGRYFF